MLASIKRVASNPLIKNYLKIFSIDVMVKGAGIILLPIYLKLMTPEEFGLYGYLVAIISTFALVFNLGVYTAQSKLYHEYSGAARGEALFTLNFILFVFIACLSLACYTFKVDYDVVRFMVSNPIDYDVYRIPVFLGVIVSVYALMLINFLLTSQDFKTLQYFNISRILLISSTSLAVLYYASPSEDSAYLRLKYACLVELLIVAFFYIKYTLTWRPILNKQVAVRAFKIALPILLSAIIGIVVNLSDRYFIEKYGSLKDLSVYNVALTFAGIIPFVFASFQNIWLPEFLKSNDQDFTRRRTRKVILKLCVIFLVLSAIILGAMQLMLYWNILDTKYSTVISLLPLLLTASILTSITTMYSNHLILLDKLYWIVIIGFPIAVLTYFSNIILVPRFSIYGAAISTVLSNGCYLVSYAILVTYLYNKKHSSSSSIA